MDYDSVLPYFREPAIHSVPSQINSVAPVHFLTQQDQFYYAPPFHALATSLEVLTPNFCQYILLVLYMMHVHLIPSFSILKCAEGRTVLHSECFLSNFISTRDDYDNAEKLLSVIRAVGSL